MSSQYTQDVEFNSAFGALQAPVHLYTAACLCGVPAAPINQHFRYLDLACGNGLTLSLLADAYPLADFVGIDINPDHIAGARKRAAKAGLSNLQFIEADIADLAAEGFEPFDYCAISGVYSWLDANRRLQTREFAQEVIKPGGLVYLDYSSQPGMAQTAPLYQILKQVGAVKPGDSSAKLSAAAGLLDTMREQGARFFQQNPIAQNRLSGIVSNPPKDEAHEVFNLQEFGLWSSEVIESMVQQGFSYVGNGGLHHNIAAFTVHARLPKQCDDLPYHLQQMLQDVAWNVAQRKDLYVRGDSLEKVVLLDAIGDATAYIAPGALSAESLARVTKGFPGVKFPARALIDTIEATVSAGSTLREVHRDLVAHGHPSTEALSVITNLLASRLLSVAVRPVPTTTPGDDLLMPSRLNQLILKEDITDELARPFTSPVVGSRVLLPIRDRLYLWAIVFGDVGNAWDIMGELREAFRGENGEPLDRAAFVDIVNASLGNFRKNAVPELLRLGILASSSTSGA